MKPENNNTMDACIPASGILYASTIHFWNTAHLANVKHSIHEPFYATTYQRY